MFYKIVKKEKSVQVLLWHLKLKKLPPQQVRSASLRWKRSNFYTVFWKRPQSHNFHYYITVQPLLFLLIPSVQFSHSVASDSLRPHGLQHARPPCPSPTPEFTQTHVHRVGDAIQPSYPLSSPSPPAPNSSQHRSLFQWVNSSHEVARVLEFQL